MLSLVYLIIYLNCVESIDDFLVKLSTLVIQNKNKPHFEEQAGAMQHTDGMVEGAG